MAVRRRQRALATGVSDPFIGGMVLGQDGEIDATENYAAVPQGGLWLLSLLMWMGRLEIFTVLVLLTPAFWRRTTA